MELGLRSKDLAEPLGVSPSVVSEWESDKLLIRQSYAIAIEHLFGISWRWLMTGEGEMWATELPAWIAKRIEAQGHLGPLPGEPTASAKALKSKPQSAPPPPPPAQALPTEGLVQVAQNLAIAQCQAAGTASDPVKIVEAFKAILGSLQS